MPVSICGQSKNKNCKHFVASNQRIPLFSSLSRSLKHQTSLEAWSTSSREIAVTWPSTSPSIKTSRPCGTSGRPRGQSLWSTRRRRTSRGRGSTTGRAGIGRTGPRVKGRSSSTTLWRSRTSGYPWETSMQIRWLRFLPLFSCIFHFATSSFVSLPLFHFLQLHPFFPSFFHPLFLSSFLSSILISFPFFVFFLLFTHPVSLHILPNYSHHIFCAKSPIF